LGVAEYFSGMMVSPRWALRDCAGADETLNVTPAMIIKQAAWEEYSLGFITVRES
jgi:hypothetical protein